MSRLLCLLRFHVYRPMKHGVGARLDARECARCGRFEIWAYSAFYRTDRQNFEPVVPA